MISVGHSDMHGSATMRSLPRGVTLEELTLCAQFMSMGFCRLGDQCASAHSVHELEGWKSQFKLKLVHLKNQSLAQKLRARLSDESVQLCLASQLPGVSITCDRALVVSSDVKPCELKWIFVLESDKKLNAVFLLRESCLENFFISTVESMDGNDYTKCNEWRNGNASVSAGFITYVVHVQFESGVFGTFRQELVFDFGNDLYITRKFCVDVLHDRANLELEQVEKTIWSDSFRWDHSNARIIPFEDKEKLSKPEEYLLRTYPAPNPENFRPTQSLSEPKFTDVNYKERMKNLITLEELEQSNLISKFNICTMLELCSSYMLTPGIDCVTKYAVDGELFAIMHLTGDLSEDTAAGRLLLTGSNEVMLKIIGDKFPEEKYPRVYEAVIEDKLKQYIYLRLSKSLVRDFGLKAEKPVTAEVQFQLNRLPFCERLFAIDRVNISHVYPSLYCDIPVPTQRLEYHEKLNERQKQAVEAITAPLSDKIPVIALVGPFGTGKTFTFAEALKSLTEVPENRVLVCTYSNSAADLYIKDHLHPYVAAGNPHARPVRIYYHRRWVNSVHTDVLEYTLYDPDVRMFRYPTKEELEKTRIVITTLSLSRKLLDVGLPRGFFTHILIDEAAQCLECDAVIPLALADERTRIALAGDYMQLSPVVYSPLAKEKGFHISLLERLYDFYPEGFPCRILLVENYRSHGSIVRFTSDLFYNGCLRSSGAPVAHPKIYPLAFYTALGEDVQDSNSTAYYNLAEVYEVVERVLELKETWPAAWGEFDEASIGVVAPYADQVVKIRAELRRKQLHGISVERIVNVQGKEFRVVIMSTVRTRLTTRMPRTDRRVNVVILPEEDYGLLSDERLVNAALTRAQSLVITVGDPIALCAVGKCRKLWEKFIDVCQRNGSFFGMQSQSLRFELDAVDLQILYGLNPLAPVFMPGTVWHPYVNRSYYDANNVHQQLRPVYLIKPIYGPVQPPLPVEGQPLIASPQAPFMHHSRYTAPVAPILPPSPVPFQPLRHMQAAYAEIVHRQQYHMQQLAQLQMFQMQIQRGVVPPLPRYIPIPNETNTWQRFPVDPNLRPPSPLVPHLPPPRYIPHQPLGRVSPAADVKPITVEELEASLLGISVHSAGKGRNSGGGMKSENHDQSYFENGVFVSNGDGSLDGSLGGSDNDDEREGNDGPME